MTLRIGILGGTFNPIHTGHCLLAEGILVKLELDYILFIPCAVPPHKRPLKLTASRHRLKMIRMAIKENHSFKVSTVELDRGGRSYSVDTLEELTKIYKGKAEFFFIIGSDSLSEFSTWKAPDILLKLCTLVAVERPGYPLTQLEKTRLEGVRLKKGNKLFRRGSVSLPNFLTGLTKGRIKGMKVVSVPTLPVSSTDIRKLVKQGKSIKYLVPEDVRKYIIKHRLYL